MIFCGEVSRNFLQGLDTLFKTCIYAIEQSYFFALSSNFSFLNIYSVRKICNFCFKFFLQRSDLIFYELHQRSRNGISRYFGAQRQQTSRLSWWPRSLSYSWAIIFLLLYLHIYLDQFPPLASSSQSFQYEVLETWSRKLLQTFLLAISQNCCSPHLTKLCYRIGLVYLFHSYFTAKNFTIFMSTPFLTKFPKIHFLENRVLPNLKLPENPPYPLQSEPLAHLPDS